MNTYIEHWIPCTLYGYPVWIFKLVPQFHSHLQVSHSEVFEEVTLELKLTPELIQTYTEYFHTHSQWHMYEPRL